MEWALRRDLHVSWLCLWPFFCGALGTGVGKHERAGEHLEDSRLDQNCNKLYVCSCGNANHGLTLVGCFGQHFRQLNHSHIAELWKPAKKQRTHIYQISHTGILHAHHNQTQKQHPRFFADFSFNISFWQRYVTFNCNKFRFLWTLSHSRTESPIWNALNFIPIRFLFSVKRRNQIYTLAEVLFSHIHHPRQNIIPFELENK